mgnify:FL=1
MAFKWCGDIDFDWSYDIDECNKYRSKEDALARINKWKEKKAGEVIVRSYKIVEEDGE